MPKLGDQGLVGIGRKIQLAGGLLNGQVGGKVAQRALGMGRGHVELLLGGLHNAGAFVGNGGLDASFVFLAFALNLGAKLLDLVVEACELGFDRPEAGVGVGGGFARGLQACPQRLRALVKDFGHDAQDGNADQQNDDGEVEELEDARRGLGFKVEGLRRPLDDGALEPEDVVLLLLGLGRCCVGLFGSGCGGGCLRRRLLRVEAEGRNGREGQKERAEHEAR